MTSEGWRMEAESLASEQVRWWLARGIRAVDVARAIRCHPPHWANVREALVLWWIERRQESA